MFIRRTEISGNEIQSKSEANHEMKISKLLNLRILNIFFQLDFVITEDCFVLLTPLKNRISTQNNLTPVQNKIESSLHNVSINQQISIINVDDISEDDLMEFIDLTSPEKPVSENLPLHYKKMMMKKFLDEENVTVFSVTYGLENQGAFGLDASVEHLLDGKNLF